MKAIKLIGFGVSNEIKKTILLISSTILCNFIYSQSYNSIIPDSDIEQFIQWEINNTSKYSEDNKRGPKIYENKPESWKTAQTHIFGPFEDNLSFENKLIYFLKDDTLFNQDDRQFLALQYDSEIICEWKMKFHNTKYKRNVRKNFHEVTIPLFSKDKTKVLFWKSFYCGSLCAQACLYVFIKDGLTRWKLVGSYSCYVS